MRYLVFLALAGLAGCDSPSPAFSRLPATRISVDGAVFAVRHTAFEAEAIRLNAQGGTTRGGIVYRGAKAMILVSGCAVVPETLEGDTNIVRADLDCPGAGPRPPRRAKPVELDCAFTGAADQGDFTCAVQR